MWIWWWDGYCCLNLIKIFGFCGLDNCLNGWFMRMWRGHLNILKLILWIFFNSQSTSSNCSKKTPRHRKSESINSKIHLQSFISNKIPPRNLNSANSKKKNPFKLKHSRQESISILAWHVGVEMKWKRRFFFCLLSIVINLLQLHSLSTT